jgi:hypothetical protein
MKLDYINDIADTCYKFMTQVINQDESLDCEELMTRLDNICHEYTYKDEDTIDIDYKKMGFTVHLNRVLGQWQLCENASYYPDGFLDDDPSESVIDVELF